jgi:hypothetical protein
VFTDATGGHLFVRIDHGWSRIPVVVQGGSGTPTEPPFLSFLPLAAAALADYQFARKLNGSLTDD